MQFKYLELIRMIEQREAVQVFQNKLIIQRYGAIEKFMSLVSDQLRNIAAASIAQSEALIAEMQTLGSNITSLQASIADLTAKLAASGADPDLVQAANDITAALGTENTRAQAALAAIIAVSTPPAVPVDPTPVSDGSPKTVETPTTT